VLKNLGTTLILCVGTVICAQADSLISLNDPVKLHGSFPTFNAVCGPDAQPAASTIDNGVFQPEETCYQKGIHWEGSTTGDTTHSISISFGGTFAIDGAIVQADDNDTYQLDYLGTDHLYHPWWSIPEISSFGLVTRPNGNETTIMTLPTVDALGVEIFATGGDGLYAVSQVEVFGNPSPVPEPRTIGLLGAGLAGLVVLVNRRRRFSQV
jgi:PEP-CTERM motif